MKRERERERERGREREKKEERGEEREKREKEKKKREKKEGSDLARAPPLPSIDGKKSVAQHCEDEFDSLFSLHRNVDQERSTSRVRVAEAIEQREPSKSSAEEERGKT